ncbi:hypothetical protein Tco_0784425 [Tanacetum coccineum]
MCHIVGIEPKFENIIKNSPYVPMAADQRKPKVQWIADERKAANLDQRLKSLIMFVLPDDQINSIINCLTTKSTWDDLKLYHEGPSDVKESKVMDLKLCYNTFKFKEGETLTQTFTRYKALINELVNDVINLSKLEINTDSELASLFGKLKYEENLIDSMYETQKEKSLVSAMPLSTAFFSTSIVQDFQDSPDDEEDTRSSQEYLNDLEKEYQARDLLAKSKRFFKKDEEEVSSDDNKMVEVKVLMALAEDNDAVSKEGARNGKRVKISMRKHVNTKILKENQNLRKELKDLTAITETWLNSSNKDLVFVKSLANDTKVSIPCVERPWLSEAEGFTLPNHDTGRILPPELQRNINDPSVAITNSLATDYDSTDESPVCSTPLPPLKKLDGAEPVSGPKNIKSILKLKSTFKAETLKGVKINEPSSAPAKGNKRSSASKVNSAPADKLKSVKIEDDPPLAIVMKELNDLKLQISKNQSSYSRSNQPQQCERTDHRTCDHAEYISTMNTSQHLKSLDYLSNECLYYPICGLCGSYDHDTNGHNRIISLEREINPRNPQHAFKRCEACGSSTYTTTGHYVIEWFKRGETLQSKKVKALKSTKAKSSNANRSKTPNKRKPIWYLDSGCSRHMTSVKSYLHKYVEQPGPKVVFGDDSTCVTEGYGLIKCNGIVFIKVAFVNGLKYNLISISQLCDAKYIVQVDEKRGTIFNSKKEIVMIAPQVRYVYVLDMTSSE